MEVKSVVIVNDFDYVQGGASQIAIETANLLSKQGFNVYFFSGSSDPNSPLVSSIQKRCTNQGEVLKDKNKIRGFFNGIYNFKAKKIFRNLLNELDPEHTVIHVHGWTKCLSSSIFDVAFRMNFKVILTLHDYFSECPNGGFFQYPQNQICTFKPLSLKCITCNCDSRNYFFKLYRVLRQFVQNKLVGLPKKLKYAIGVSDFCVDILKPLFPSSVLIKRIYNPIEKRNERNNNYYDSDVFLYVGRVSREKGVSVFCRVVEELHLKGIVVGDGSEKPFLEQKYPNIQFVGWKTRDEVMEYMMNAKVLIFPSLLYETAGLTILEALSCGVPCIVSSKCAGQEFIKCGINGYIYHNYEELKICIKNILDRKLDPSQIDFFEDMSSKKYIKEICDFYEHGK